MIIALGKLPPEGETFSGTHPASMLELEGDRFVRPDGPVRYDLFAQVVGSELIVQGSVNTTVQLLCGRCGGFFSTTLALSSFLRAFPVREELETVDITGDLREDLLVELPSYPTCSWTGGGVCPYSGVNLEEVTMSREVPGESRWEALDQWPGKANPEHPDGPEE